MASQRGNEGNDTYLSAAAITSDGSYVVAGSVGTALHGWDFIVYKLSSNGTYLWEWRVCSSQSAAAVFVLMSEADARGADGNDWGCRVGGRDRPGSIALATNRTYRGYRACGRCKRLGSRREEIARDAIGPAFSSACAISRRNHVL